MNFVVSLCPVFLKSKLIYIKLQQALKGSWTLGLQCSSFLVFSIIIPKQEIVIAKKELH